MTLAREVGRVARGDSGTAADVDHGIAGPEADRACRETRVVIPADDHAQRGDEPGGAGESGIVGVVVGN